MIEQTQLPVATPEEFPRDERSMRVFEYAMAFVALLAALLLSFR
ncbi:MAG TPA: hypothetical protein VGC90_03345 [Candidatus Limnocylindrales bacterium]|jgi:hypothetical protein